MDNKNSHLSYFISGGLVLSFILSLVGSLYPEQSLIQTTLFKIDALFAISAFSCLAAKSSGERFDVAAAGFSILAIAQGLFLSEIDQVNKWNYASESLGVLFMIPAFFMISYYTIFPKWLRISGVISIIPFIALLIIRSTVGEENTALMENIVFLLFQLVTLCWAWEIWKLSELKTKNKKKT